VADHSIRLVVADDLRRSRLTVFFRLLLAIPHFIWLFLWGIAVFFAAIAGWFATLFAGRLPGALHRFLAAYVRYWTHVYAYLYLAANPFPGFTGEPGRYPVDVQIEPPTRQNRWKVGFRILLVLPAAILASVLAGAFGGGGGGGGGARDDFGAADAVGFAPWGGLVAFVVAFLAWFAILARGRAPSGFRDLLVAMLRYSAQVNGYLLLLSDRYPNSDLYALGALWPERPLAVRLVLADDLRRSRLTVFFRLLLALPHVVWVTLWGIAASVVVVLNWFVTLVAGRPLLGFHRFLTAFVRYQAHLLAFVSLAANPFPGFTGAPGYPLDLEIDEPLPQRRLVTLFRIFLAVPAYFVLYALTIALYIAAFLGWFASLATGRMPPGLRSICAHVIHYQAQFYAYVYVLTERYPYSGPVTGTEPPEEAVEPEVAPAWPPAASEAA
jgi:uncharacterized protein DUF4389